MNRCSKCILPENYPGITFSNEGVCNYCINYKERKYLGGNALKAEIESFLKTKNNRNENYDCVLSFSGGRDSSFLLYYLVKILGLRVLAYSTDNGFIPEQTKQNIKMSTDILNVKLVIEEHDYLKNCIKHHLLSWMHNPSPAMIGVLCTGCKLGIDMGRVNFATKNNIPIIISGGTPFEGQGYKFNIMKMNANSKKMSSFVLGYLFHIIRNPKWIMNSTCSINQIKEFYYHHCQKCYTDNDILTILPFRDYIRWNENEVISTIENKLNWKTNRSIETTWRGDCYIGFLKSYLYKKYLGFNDKDDGLSSLVRDGQITREEALERVKTEGKISEDVVKDIFDKFELDYSNLEIALNSNCEH